MKHDLATVISSIIAKRQTTLLCLLLITSAAYAQSAQPTNPLAKATIPVLFVSDIHFEPFWDPAKVPQLAVAPIDQWNVILAAPPSPDQQQRFAALQQTCHARGADTSFALFHSSLTAMRSHAASVSFAAMSGDLISHAFQCKYNALVPNSTPEAYRAFVEKTLDYVIEELDKSVPGVPVYVAMGNNDSDCGDYRLDANSEFLRVTGKEISRDFPASERTAAEESFAAGGYYSVTLPAPIENTRLLVLNDIFMSSNYATCGGRPDPKSSDAQLAWLNQQLAEARAKKQKIWVMGHIPPGVDLYSTASRMIDVCGGKNPVMFLASEKLADVLAEYGDVVELAIFAHTHMDELRLLKPETAAGKGVAVKMVPSVSPIHGNHPSITLAQVDPSTAALVDYKVYAASNATGVDATWTQEYDFARSFHQTEFTSSSISKVIAGFAADPSARTPASENYIENSSVGYASPLLRLAWPQYVCTLSNYTAESFRSCACPAGP
ncbi:MAG: metallophosphoesterase [Terracidiphilus sp.]|jgi:sphingomyelin phosphodiesterase acid-like 3